jgi:2'-hydroxyisoflavone reductase
MTTRREFLQGLAGATVLLPSAISAMERPAPLRILILGGTGFLGPHLVHVARTRGHSVSMLNRGRREIGMFESDFKDVEAIQGDRAQPNGLDNLKGKRWDVVIETSGYRHAWTRDAAQALKGSAGRYVYVSSTGVYWPYHTVNIAENGRVLLKDEPPLPQPSYGVMKALSENEVRDAFGSNALIVRPGYIVGPGDGSDRWTYWPVRIARGGEILVPGKGSEQVQYIDVRDLAEWMIGRLENGTNGTFNLVGPARPQTMKEFVNGLVPLATTPRSFTWIDDYEWLKKYPLTKTATGENVGLVELVPWIMPLPDELGHMRIDGSKARGAGLKFRSLAVTARDALNWRLNEAPAALRAQPRYGLTPEQEPPMLSAWKSR